MILSILAQTLVIGTVSGDSARPIQGAIVEVKAIARSATTGAWGAYSLTVDRPGAYQLEVRAMGYSPASRGVRLAILLWSRITP